MIPGFLSFPPFFSVITTYPHLNSCCSMNRVRLCSQQRDGLWGEKDTRRFETHPCPGQPKHLCGIGFSAVRQIYVRFQQNKGCTESAHIPQTYLLLFYPPRPHHLTPGRRRLHFVVWARGSHGRSLRWGITKFQYSTVGRVEHQEVALSIRCYRRGN